MGGVPLQVVPGRLELPTSTLSVWRSNRLSYRTGIARAWPDRGRMYASSWYRFTQTKEK